MQKNVPCDCNTIVSYIITLYFTYLLMKKAGFCTIVGWFEAHLNYLHRTKDYDNYWRMCWLFSYFFPVCKKFRIWLEIPSQSSTALHPHTACFVSWNRELFLQWLHFKQIKIRNLPGIMGAIVLLVQQPPWQITIRNGRTGRDFLSDSHKVQSRWPTFLPHSDSLPGVKRPLIKLNTP